MDEVAFYQQQIENLQKKLYAKQYQILLNFINDWLQYSDNNKLLSLSEFKKIKETYLLNHPEYVKKLLMKYQQIFEKEFVITLNITKIEHNNRYIIKVIRLLLKQIEYTLAYYKHNNERLYYIRRNRIYA